MGSWSVVAGSACPEVLGVKRCAGCGVPGEVAQHTCVCRNGERQLSQGHGVSVRPNPCCCSLVFPHLEKSLSPCVALQEVPVQLGFELGMLPALAFGGNLFLGLLFTLLLVHLFLSGDNDLKIISFLLAQKPPIAEIFFLYPSADLNSLHPPLSTWHLEGRDKSIWHAKT